MGKRRNSANRRSIIPESFIKALRWLFAIVIGAAITAIVTEGITNPPQVPTNTPTATFTNTPTATSTHTATVMPTATETPTNTPTATLTDTPTATPTATETATNTPSPIPSDTPTVTNTPTAPPTMTDTPTSTPASPSAVAIVPMSNSVNMRSKASTSGGVVANLAAGLSVPITAYTDCSGTIWWKVSFEDQLGWVRDDVVSTQGDIDSVPEISPGEAGCPELVLVNWIADPAFPAGKIVGRCPGGQGQQLSHTGGGWVEARIISFPNPSDWSSYRNLTIQVWTPVEAASVNVIAQAFVRSSPNQIWFDTGYDVSLRTSGWTTVPLDLRNVSNLDDIRQIGLKVGFTTSSPLTVEFCVGGATLTR